jgi:hypothetical protein
MELTDSKGNFSVPVNLSRSKPTMLTAGKEGWFNNGVNVTAPKSLIPFMESSVDHQQLLLYPVSRQDNDRYRFISPAQCAQCHNTIARYWDQSKMAHATSNPKVINMYDGTSASSKLAGPGYQIDNPGEAGNCAICHAPSAAVTTGASRDLNSILRTRSVEWDGVSCDYCHKVTKVIREEKSPSKMKPILRRQQSPRSGSILVFGPYDDVVNGYMSASYSSVYGESVFCATCHDQFETLPGDTEWKRTEVYSDEDWQAFGLTGDDQVPIQTTYREWKRWQSSLDPGDPDRGKNCQSCHMSWRKDMLPYDEFIVDGQARAALGVRRDPATINPHQFDGTTPTQLENSLALEIEGDVQDSSLKIKIHVTNVSAGHRVPTGETMRSVMLVVNGTDSKGIPLALENGETLPDWAGLGSPEEGNYGGLPGAMFARVLRGQDNQLNVPFWQAMAVDSDTRIKPKTTIVKEFEFSLRDPDDEPSVEARLVFRPAVKSLADVKGWENIDTIITSGVW